MMDCSGGPPERMHVKKEMGAVCSCPFPSFFPPTFYLLHPFHVFHPFLHENIIVGHWLYSSKARHRDTETHFAKLCCAQGKISFVATVINYF